MGQHGFARDMEFEKINDNSYVLKYNEKTLEKYPYKFELQISYETTENSVITRYCVKNLDDKRIAFGLGAHPAYKCNYSNEKYYFKFEKVEDEVKIYELQDGLISNKKIAKEQYINKDRIYLKQNTFEKDAIIMKNLKSEKISLYENNNKLLEFSFKGFPYLAIWSKKDAPFVCIEPWFNTADQIDSTGNFEEKEDLIELELNESFEAEYEVKFF